MREFHQGMLSSSRRQGRANARVKGEYLLFHCLIVSRHEERQEMLARAAVGIGWEAVLCSDAETALAHKRCRFMQLAIVDLESDSSGEFQELVEHLSASLGLLTVVCGRNGDLQEEIWVRQVGVWLYLPGVTEGTNVSLLCGEAKHLVERMHVAANARAERTTALRRAR
jgi:hypothetical protein